MVQIILKPLIGIEIEKLGDVKLGQTRKEVEKLLGKPTRDFDGIRCFYNDLELRIDYDNHDSVEFIEFIFGPTPEKTQLIIFEANPFAIEAEQLVEILKRENNGSVDVREAPHAYAFVNISVGIWRDAVPGELDIATTDIRRDGTYDESKDSIDDDFRKSRHFWTIGIGTKNYYD